MPAHALETTPAGMQGSRTLPTKSLLANATPIASDSKFQRQHVAAAQSLAAPVHNTCLRALRARPGTNDGLKRPSAAMLA
jgi:hypothetical protein